MAQKSINLGTGYNTKDGDSVRDAFNKVNQNFTELYTLTGGTVADLTELAQDYSAEMFVNATHTGITVNYDDVNNVLELTGFDGDYNSLSNQPTLFDPSAVSQSIIPDTDVTYDLGSATNRFRDLYLSGSTIDLGGTTLSVVGGELQLGGVKVPTTIDVAASIAAGGNPFDQDLNTTDSPAFAGITFSDATTQSTAWTGSAPGFTYSELGGTSEISVTADTFDFGDGKTIDMQNSSVLFNDSSIQDFAPGNIYANSGQFLYVTGKHAGGTATNVAFTYDTNINNPRQTFYGKTEFAFNGQTPVVDFGNATISNWTDPNVVNTHSGSANIVVGGQTATMDFLTVRIVENSPGDIDVEFNYDAGGTVAVSANGDLPNRFNGTTTFAAGNTTWTTMNILDVVGDKGEFTIVDHSGHKIYRVTTIAREMPGVNPGDAYCVIERLK